MIKNIITGFILIVLLTVFSVFIIRSESTHEVLSVISPTKFVIDLDNNKTIDSDEIICIPNVESFSLVYSKDFVNKYSKKLSLNNNDFINMGYMANEFAMKRLQNKMVTVKLSKIKTSDCTVGKIFISGSDYEDILKESGFALIDGNVYNKDAFKDNFENSKKLNLVVLNHHSNKYHTLDCEYGKLANDMIILPLKQVPKSAIPCKSCIDKPKVSTKKVTKISTIPMQPSVPKFYVSSGDIKLFFNDFTSVMKPDNTCSTSVCKEFVSLINSSQNSIDMALYGYENIPQITSALRSAADRGVKIRFVYDDNSTSTPFYADNSIIKGLSLEFKSDVGGNATVSNMLMHNKFIIFDDSIVLTGSMNFSKSGLSNYDVNEVAVISSKDVALLYKAEFEQMLSGKFHVFKKKLNMNNKFVIGNSKLEVYFSPQDKTASRIVDLISKAKKNIYISSYIITHSRITSELINAKKRGVDVKIISDGNSSIILHNQNKVLRENSIPLKLENYAGKVHSKTITVDGTYMIMGSMNFSNSGENKNDENTLIIQNPVLVKNYNEFFNYLWNKIPDKFLKLYPRSEGPESIGSCSDGVDNNFNGKIDADDPNCAVQ